MSIVLVVLQDPDDNPEAQSEDAARVWAKDVRAYTICVDIPIGSYARFFDYLDGFLGRELTACRRDGHLIFTAYAASWDPVLRIKNWASEWVGTPATAKSP